MPDRSPDRPLPGPDVPPPADATRDITLPPLPDRPGPAVRPEWASYVPATPPADDAAPAQRSALEPPTDRFPPRPEHRSSTLAFQPPPPVQLLKVSVGPRRRAGWLWVVAVLVPLLVIVASGVWLLVLFYGG
jgi:hypothetical protein